MNTSWPSICQVPHSWERGICGRLLLTLLEPFSAIWDLWLEHLLAFDILVPLGSFCICSSVLVTTRDGGFHWEAEGLYHCTSGPLSTTLKKKKVVGLCPNSLSLGECYLMRFTSVTERMFVRKNPPNSYCQSPSLMVLEDGALVEVEV